MNVPGLFRRGSELLHRALLAFADRYNQTARPFDWKFTTSDLTALLRPRSKAKTQRATSPAASQPDNGRVTTPDEFTGSPTKPTGSPESTNYR